MKIFIEGYVYRAEKVREILSDLSPLESVEGLVSVSYVGYFYNTHISDYVFILPKVLVDESGRVFSSLDPHDIIDPNRCHSLTQKQKGFIYDFAVWIYRTIDVFNRSNPGNDIIYKRRIPEMRSGKRVANNTLLDILLALLRISKEHHTFFTTTIRNLHTGRNKINWHRTISSSTAWLQKGTPLYLNPVSKKRVVDNEEELIIIYLSILRYICDTYGFSAKINLGLELVVGKKFDHYLNGFGKRRLRQIKYRYYSDILLHIWELCYAFFDRAHMIRIRAEQKEYLLAKNFNLVFEAIIDELIGDKNIPAGLKDQEDGKRVDHMYKYRSLIDNQSENSVYYIGDSKYYKMGNRISKESIYKQFTYARNVIQWNLDLFLNDSDSSLKEDNPKYRDDLTEGYNIIPNFFISANVEKDLSYKDTITPSALRESVFVSRHFENRLFDRDTLLVYHYDVNFLYIISLYARNNHQQQSSWRKKVRELFREKIQNALQEHFSFYAMTAKWGTDSETYINDHFRQLLGKVYRPFTDTRYVSLALDKEDVAYNDTLLRELSKSFHIVSCELGKDPAEVLQVAPVEDYLSPLDHRNGILMVMMEGYHSKSSNFLSKGEIAVGIKPTPSGMQIIKNLDKIGSILFHTYNDKNNHLFALTGTPEIIYKDEMESMRPNVYPNTSTCYVYLRVKFAQDRELPTTELHPQLVRPRLSTERYDAAFATIAQLREGAQPAEGGLRPGSEEGADERFP